MSGSKKPIEVSADFLDAFLSAIGDGAGKEVVKRVVSRFEDSGLPIKCKRYDAPCMIGVFRILCYVRKSAEAVVINSKGMGRDSLSVQMRIEDRGSLDRLDRLSPNIRERILSAADCRNCSADCAGGKYEFSYNGVDYVKCRVFSVNFLFQDFADEDIESMLRLVDCEIAYKRPRGKPQAI